MINWYPYREKPSMGKEKGDIGAKFLDFLMGDDED